MPLHESQANYYSLFLSTLLALGAWLVFLMVLGTLARERDRDLVSLTGCDGQPSHFLWSSMHKRLHSHFDLIQWCLLAHGCCYLTMRLLNSLLGYHLSQSAYDLAQRNTSSSLNAFQNSWLSVLNFISKRPSFLSSWDWSNSVSVSQDILLIGPCSAYQDFGSSSPRFARDTWQFQISSCWDSSYFFGQVSS